MRASMFRLFFDPSFVLSFNGYTQVGEISVISDFPLVPTRALARGSVFINLMLELNLK